MSAMLESHEVPLGDSVVGSTGDALLDWAVATVRDVGWKGMQLAGMDALGCTVARAGGGERA